MSEEQKQRRARRRTWSALVALAIAIAAWVVPMLFSSSSVGPSAASGQVGPLCTIVGNLPPVCPAASATATASVTATATESPAASPSPSPSPTTSATACVTAVASPTASASATASATATASPTASATACATASPTTSPTVSATATKTPIIVCCRPPKGKRPKLKFKIKKANEKRLVLKARLNMKGKATFRVLKRKHNVGRKSKRFKKRGRKRVKILLQTVKLGTKRPVRIKVVGQAKSGKRKSKKVRHRTRIR
jgi:hypothetical protein